MATNDQANGTQSAGNGATSDNAQGAASATDNANGSTPLAGDQKQGQDQQQSQADQQGQEQQKADDKKDEKPAGAPEAYADFKAPEGVELDKDILSEFVPFAKELNLTQENAQKLVDFGAKIITKQFEAIEAQHVKWAEDARADPEIGGDKLPANLALGKRVIDFAGGAELRKELNDSGFGNNPALIKAFAKLGKLISDDMLERGQPSAGQVDPLAKMYPSMAKG
ncbi:hypothetical protein [Dongia sp.]|uniref:hypothetical protein n=1 Tax=Dongia sp. TaxID=1977262 RepID=UPI0035AE1009